MIAGRHAVTANLFALSQAQELAARDVDNREIYLKTGWFVGGDGKWRYEIDDSAAQIAVPERVLEQLKRRAERPDDDDYVYERPDTRLIEYVDHPALYAAYPQLRHVMAGIPFRELSGKTLARAMGGVRIEYASEQSLTDDMVDTTTLHEIQHLIQRLEGFQLGAASSTWEKWRQYRGTEPKMDDDKMYRNTYGECEARDTESRRSMSKTERATTLPFGVKPREDARLDIGSGMRVACERYWLQYNSTVVLPWGGGGDNG